MRVEAILELLWTGFSRLFSKWRYPQEGENDEIIESRTTRWLLTGLLFVTGCLILAALYVLIVLGEM